MKNVRKIFSLVAFVFTILLSTNATALFFVELDPGNILLTAEITGTDDEGDTTPTPLDSAPQLFVKIRNDASRHVGVYIYKVEPDSYPQMDDNGLDDKFIGPATDIASLDALKDVISAWSLSLDSLGSSRTYFFPVPNPELLPGEEVRFRVKLVGPAIGLSGINLSEDDAAYDLLLEATARTLFDKVVVPLVSMATGKALDANKIFTLWSQIGVEFSQFITTSWDTLKPLLDNGRYAELVEVVMTWAFQNENVMAAAAEITASPGLSDLFKYLSDLLGHWTVVLDATNAMNNLMGLVQVEWYTGVNVYLSRPKIEHLGQGEVGTVIIQGKGFDPYVKANNKIFLGDSWQEVAEGNYQVESEGRITVNMLAEGFTEGDIRLAVSGLYSESHYYDGYLFWSELTISEPLNGQLLSGPESSIDVVSTLSNPPDPFPGGEAILRIEGIADTPVQITQSEFSLQNTRILDHGGNLVEVNLEIGHDGRSYPLTSKNPVTVHVPDLSITSPTQSTELVANEPFTLSAELIGLPDPLNCAGVIYFKLFIEDEHRSDLNSEVLLEDAPNYSQILTLPEGSYDARLEVNSSNITCSNNTPAPNLFVRKGFTLTVGSPPSIDRYTNSIGQTFVRIEPGTFQMGVSPEESAKFRAVMFNQEGWAVDEDYFDWLSPYHAVTFDTRFYIQETEVTQEQWLEVMGSNPSEKICEGCPVNKVSINMMEEFIGEMNTKGEGVYRLPTDEEWEYTCRAGTTTHFPTAVANGWLTSFYTPGNDEAGAISDAAMDTLGWYQWNTYNPSTDWFDGVEPVAQLQANPWGLYDMHGNVSEFVISERFKKVWNPLGLENRGGSSDISASQMFCSYSVGSNVPQYLGQMGFRLVLERD